MSRKINDKVITLEPNSISKSEVIKVIVKFFEENYYIEDGDVLCDELLRDIEEIPLVGTGVKYSIDEAHGIAYVREDHSQPFEPIAISKE